MTEVLLLGWSDIVRRRVLPALRSIPTVTRVHAATQSGLTANDGLDAIDGLLFEGPESIEEALDALSEAAVYVSGVNTVHAARVAAALEHGHHVIVDKPAFLDAADAGHCLDLARREGLLLTEATVWTWHTQVQRLLSEIHGRGLAVADIEATFVIPGLPESNFRRDPARGGGVAADMAAYAMSPGRLLCGQGPEQVAAAVTARAEDGLDLAMSIEAAYPGDVTMRGTFSMDGDYVNRLVLSGTDWTAVLSPAFSSRPDAVLRVDLRIDGADLGFDAQACDPFAEFLHAALTEGVRDPGTWTSRSADAVEDEVRLLAALRAAESWTSLASSRSAAEEDM